MSCPFLRNIKHEYGSQSMKTGSEEKISYEFMFMTFMSFQFDAD